MQIYFNGAMIDVEFHEIKMVEQKYDCRTYDIEVEDAHCFIAKNPETGLESISHNSALISLSNLSDQRMRDAKSGQWWAEHPERALANNSVAYTEKPEIEVFMDEWLSLVKSKSGDRR